MTFDHESIGAREFRVLCSGDLDEHCANRVEWTAQAASRFARGGQPDAACWFAMWAFKYARELERRKGLR